MTVKEIDAQLAECNEILEQATLQRNGLNTVILGMDDRIEQLNEAKLKLN